MSPFESGVLVLLGVIAFALFYVAAGLNAIRTEVAEIWKRMQRID